MRGGREKEENISQSSEWGKKFKKKGSYVKPRLFIGKKFAQ